MPSTPARKPRPLIRSRLLVDAQSWLRAHDVDTEALLRDVGLQPFADGDHEVTVPVDVHARYFEEAARRARDPLLGVHLADAMNRGTFGVLEFACRSASTVRQALRSVARYDALLNGAVEIRFDEGDGDGDAILRHRLPDEPDGLGRECNEYTVALFIFEIRRATGVHRVATSLSFAHARPVDAAAVSELLGTKAVAYEAGENALSFSRAILDTPMPTADPALFAFLEEQASRAAGERAVEPTFRAGLERLVREALPMGTGDLSGIARGLGMSDRTLQRRLAEEGTSFHEVMDSVREQAARSAVIRSDQSLDEIAASLGYASVRPFIRAFKRWTGTTPSRYRAEKV